MVDFGMSPMDAILSATEKAAQLLGVEGQMGMIVPGAHADIIAVRGDPLKDITELERVRFVMKDGRVFRSEMAAEK
jgi:imidazolonepropionase-like amidohydrolase